MTRRDLNFGFLKIVRILVALKIFKHMLHNLGYGHRAMDVNVHWPLKGPDDNQNLEECYRGVDCWSVHVRHKL